MADERRRWFHPKRSDLAFVAGVVVFLWNGIFKTGATDPSIVYGSIVLMGFGVAGRIDLSGDK